MSNHPLPIENNIIWTTNIYIDEYTIKDNNVENREREWGRKGQIEREKERERERGRGKRERKRDK